jgi:hypothetical protein
LGGRGQDFSRATFAGGSQGLTEPERSGGGGKPCGARPPSLPLVPEWDS